MPYDTTRIARCRCTTGRGASALASSDAAVSAAGGVAGAAGGALLVGAVAMFWWSRDRVMESPVVGVGPLHDGVAATLTIGF